MANDADPQRRFEAQNKKNENETDGRKTARECDSEA